MRRFALVCLVGSALLLGGCSSIAKGVTQAIIDPESKTDTRACDITGSAFGGVAESLTSPNRTKVLMVHGIGKHAPYYSARFKEKLGRELGLDQIDAQVREIKLDTAAALPGKKMEDMGTLIISRLMSSSTGREILFYELTWSGISQSEKKIIEFDDSDAYTYRRASINKMLKYFMNATVPDVLAYEGSKRSLINTSVAQSLCWMFSANWTDLPASGAQYCEIADADAATHIAQDDYFIVTHSLGSRIAIDTLNNFAAESNIPGRAAINHALKKEDITIFMLANQLPFLQIGQTTPADAGRIADYCTAGAKDFDKRLMNKSRIVAFNDPNDILSYPVPPDFAEKYIDNRICPEIVNVDINVAPVVSMISDADFANPLAAHSGYHEDERVIKLIAHGLKRGDNNPTIQEKCRWTETVE